MHSFLNFSVATGYLVYKLDANFMTHESLSRLESYRRKSANMITGIGIIIYSISITELFTNQTGQISIQKAIILHTPGKFMSFKAPGYYPDPLS